MSDANYERILEKIAKTSGIDKEEIERKVEAKRAKLAGLISKEGAAQVIAAELGINFDNEKLKIEELLPGMRKVNVVGKIITVFPVRSYKNNKGIESKVVNFILADDTSNTKVVLWDTNHISLIEKGEISEGSVIEIINGSMRSEEIHLGSFSDLKISKEKLKQVIEERVVNQKSINNFAVGDTTKTRAFIVQSFEPKFFYVCPECRKKAVQENDSFVCNEHGKVAPEKRALLNLVLDDGTETIRAVIFHDKLSGLGLSSPEAFEKEKILGKEMIFSGNVRMNKYFNNPEFIIDDIQEIDLDKLIESLEKRNVS